MFLFIVSFIYSFDEIDVWKRTAPNVDGSIDTLYLDMSTGYVWADDYYVYMVVYELKTNQRVALTFENGEYFVTRGSWWSEELRKKVIDGDFDIEKYLREMPKEKIENNK